MNYHIRIPIFLLLFFSSAQLRAQDPIFTQYLLVPETFNPAFTGLANAWNAGIINRRQWPDGNRRMDTRYGYANNMVTDQLAVGGTILNHHEVFKANFFNVYTFIYFFEQLFCFRASYTVTQSSN